MSAPAEGNLARAAISFAVFAGGNIGLNYFNSWALRPSPVGVPGQEKGSFSFPFFYTMFHMGASALAALILMLTCAKPPNGAYPSFSQLWEYKFQVLPIAILTVLNNGLNNWSLQLVALFVNQVIKATGPLPTSIFEYIFQGKVYGGLTYAAVSMIVFGSVLANAPLFSVPGSETSLVGVVLCIISLMAASLRPVLQKILLSNDGKTKLARAPLTPSQALFWDASISFCMMLLIWLCSAERVPSVEYLLSHTANPQSGLLGVAIIVAGSTMAFTFNIAMYYYILYTSALTSTVGSAGIKILLICLSALTDHVQSLVSWAGITLVVLSIATYAYLSLQEKKAPRDAGGDKGGGAGGGAETTPLTQQISERLSQATSAYPLVGVGFFAACVMLVFGVIAVPIMVVTHNHPNMTCAPPSESAFAGRGAAVTIPNLPTTASSDVTLVLGGMMTPQDAAAALAIPGLTHLVMYNNEASSRCASVEQASRRGSNCGQPCRDLMAEIANLTAASSVAARCVDRPNLGRGEGGFFQHVRDGYGSLGGVYIFSQSTVTNDEGRLAPVTALVREAAAGDSTPSCNGPPSSTVSAMAPGQLLDAGRTWSLLNPGTCARCAPNTHADSQCRVLCNVTLLDRTFYDVGQAEAGAMTPWLHRFAPQPGNATLAPACYLGYARTSAELIRRRPRGDYSAIYEDLARCASPEASHFVERAMLYLFSSI